MIATRFIWAFILLFTHCAFATVSIPLLPGNNDKKPAADLIYQGQQIDAYQAFELGQKGVDLSGLNPKESHLWQNIKHDLVPFNPPKQQYSFSDYKVSPTEFFRSYLTGEDKKRYLLTASLENHENIIRAGLLRLLGYDIEIPKYFKKLSIHFSSEEKKKEYIEKVGEQTLTKRTKWIDESSTETTLVIKDVILEAAELKNVNIYLPFMIRARQKDRRVFRSLLSIYSLINFKQSINATEWKVGKIFDNHLMFSLPYASQFRDVSVDDLRWMQKKINKIKRDEILKIVSLAQYPQELIPLVVEKIIARMTSLSEHLNIESSLSFNRHVTTGAVKAGKLTGEIATDRVVRYFKEDEESPYQFKDLFRLYRSQATYNLLSKVLTDAVDKFVPGINITGAANNIQNQINEYKVNNSIQQGDSMPLKAFAYPMAYIGASANRNIVFGKQFGRSAPIQLVDSVSASANLGVFTMLTGISDTILPSISAQASYTRSYTHVRPMPDLTTATSQHIKKILVPKLMKSVGKIINLDITCSLAGVVNVVEEELAGEKIVYLKYDKSIANGKEKAIEKRQELIDSGIPEEIILLVAIDLAKECVSELADKKTKNLDTFLKEFALNETFMISDSVNLMKTLSANIPLGTFASFAINASVRSESARGLLKTITLRKTENHMEVTIQKQNNLNKSLGMNLNYFIEILNGTKKWLEGKQQTQIYKIPVENIDDDKKSTVLAILYDLFTNNSLLKLQEHYSPIILQHDVNGVLNSVQFLWLKHENMRLDNYVEIELPAGDHPELSPSERTKKLFSTSSYRRNGKDIFGLISKVINRIVSFIQLGQSPPDAGQAIKGSSKSRYYTTEADISESTDPLITSKVEYIWKGWNAKYKKMNNIFNFIENLFDETQMNYTVDRTPFISEGDLKGYEVKTTILVYPEFYQEFKKRIINSPLKTAIRILRNLYGEERWDRYCSEAQFTIHNSADESMCMPKTARRMLAYRDTGFPIQKVPLVKAYNKILLSLMEGYNRKKVLKWISKENMFSSTRVTGFKENSEKGYVDYISNSYGQYNREYGTGIFDQIGTVLGIAPFELRVLNYTPGI